MPGSTPLHEKHPSKCNHHKNKDDNDEGGGIHVAPLCVVSVRSPVCLRTGRPSGEFRLAEKTGGCSLAVPTSTFGFDAPSCPESQQLLLCRGPAIQSRRRPPGGCMVNNRGAMDGAR